MEAAGSGASDASGTRAGAADSDTADSGATDSGATGSGAADSGAADSGAADSGAAHGATGRGGAFLGDAYPWGRAFPNLDSQRVGANVTDACDEREGKPRVSLAEGLAELTQRALAAVDSSARRDHYRVYIHLDTDGGWLTGQPRLPAHIVEKMTCDGLLQPVWETHGTPVNVGRSHRTVPQRVRRLLDDRDRGCRYPAAPR
ncbi:hypothetical protein BJY21_001097 [Kineosphaera limosa]|uniref:Uncharacterized protein n=1 Tax=Kineosphaera limosa NBRC 100340 TaxID=1184609 RepID=K6WP02_9MICO|nr:DUF222 domain-containing protein [Kineosphaera limosa]NYD99912.1 hypothetical protein [Kineosphaera limosa]GAB95551.1 hypothetical protein KILIM_022_00360 [Kineosphaera limosa NBRC 100340]